MANGLSIKLVATVLPNTVVVNKFAMPERDRLAAAARLADEVRRAPQKIQPANVAASPSTVKVVAATMVQGFSPKKAMAVDLLLLLPRLLVGKVVHEQRPHLQKWSAPEATRFLTQAHGDASMRLAKPLPGIYEALVVGLGNLVAAGTSLLLGLAVGLAVGLAALPVKAVCAIFGQNFDFFKTVGTATSTTVLVAGSTARAAQKVLLAPAYAVSELEAALLRAVAPHARYYQEPTDG